MSHFADAAEAKRHRDTYLKVFGALAGLTAVTVGVAMIGLYFHWPVPFVVAVALFVATIKGSLVACYFMHLLTENRVLYVILALCVVFFVVLMLLPSVTTSESVGSHVNLQMPAHPQSHH